MTKKLKVLEVDNPNQDSFAGIQINEENDIVIIDLRPVKKIVEDSHARIKHLLLRLRGATPARALEISDRIGIMARKFMDYKDSRNN